MSGLSGETRLVPIIGDPIRYVESPMRLSRTFAERGQNAICVPLHVPAGELEAVMAALQRVRNVEGILVTMPHKFAAFAFCASSSERAEQLGVVSVARREHDGAWHGDMLDGLAFVKALTDHGAQPRGSRALLLGVGGAGSAIALALLEAGVRELVVYDPDPARLDGLLHLLSEERRVGSGPPDPTGFDLVCNATPLGMEEADPLPVDARLLNASMFVGDVIAGHGTTPLLSAAHAAGCQTASGAHMVDAAQELMADFLLRTGDSSTVD